MSEEKRDQVEVICENLFKRYPVLCVEKLKSAIDNGAEDAQAAVLLSNKGKNKEAAKAAAFAIAKAPLTLVAGVTLAATQVAIGGVVLPISLVRMALEKTDVKAEVPAAPAAPAAE